MNKILFFYYYLIFFKNSNELKFKKNILIKEKIKNQLENNDNNEKEWMLCSLCKNRITKKQDLIKINDSFIHTFSNPGGIIYCLNCYKDAPGTITYGRKILDYSWFPGYTWQITLCSNCKNHIGWKYESISDNSIFFGLISDRLIDENN